MLAFNPDSRPSASDSLRHPCFTAGKRASGQAESHAGGEQASQSSPSAAVPQSGAGLAGVRRGSHGAPTHARGSGACEADSGVARRLMAPTQDDRDHERRNAGGERAASAQPGARGGADAREQRPRKNGGPSTPPMPAKRADAMRGVRRPVPHVGAVLAPRPSVASVGGAAGARGQAKKRATAFGGPVPAPSMFEIKTDDELRRERFIQESLSAAQEVAGRTIRARAHARAHVLKVRALIIHALDFWGVVLRPEVCRASPF